MSKLFISHAAADRALADALKDMVATSVGIHPGEIFYSSGSGTGIPGGRNFVEYIRDEMEDATYVLSVITPSYLASEFCLAELGAVWYSADKEFHPLCTPAIDRNKLRATLTGIQIDKLSDPDSLHDLLQRLCRHFERDHIAAACSAQVEPFLAGLDAILGVLPAPQTIPLTRLEECEDVRQKLAQELAGERERYGALERRYAELEQAKTAEEVAALALPEGLEDRIEALRATARKTVRPLPHIVRRAFPFKLRDEGLPWGDGLAYDHEDIRIAIDKGFLVDRDDETVHLNPQWPEIEQGIAAVGALQECLDELDPDETKWFRDTYGVPPDLSQSAAFDELI